MISQETREIERRFSLHCRCAAVKTLVHAMDWIRNDLNGIGLLDRINALELLSDGIMNALDGRSTGREFRTLRHSAMSRLDPQNHPTVAEDDRRCHYCGAVCPEPFSQCSSHIPKARV